MYVADKLRSDRPIYCVAINRLRRRLNYLEYLLQMSTHADKKIWTRRLQKKKSKDSRI